MITKELLKKKIDNVQDQYLVPLYKIIKTFEEPDDSTRSAKKATSSNIDTRNREWKKFIETFAGSLSNSPIERGSQGKFEIRESFK